MRQATLVALALTGTASAADLPGTVWKYIQGKVQQKPMMELNMFGLVARLWMAPAGLQAQAADLAYLPDTSTNHWAFTLTSPRLKTADYVGTHRLTLLGKTGKTRELNVYSIDAGLFRGLLAVDGVAVSEKGKRSPVVVVLTREFASTEEDLNRFVQ